MMDNRWESYLGRWMGHVKVSQTDRLMLYYLVHLKESRKEVTRVILMGRQMEQLLVQMLGHSWASRLDTLMDLWMEQWMGLKMDPHWDTCWE